MIYSDNAPELENLLHKEFDDRRLNKVNSKKEYFRVTLKEIEEVVKEKFAEEVDFIKIAEAQQYRETQQIIRQLELAQQEPAEETVEKYPASLF